MKSDFDVVNEAFERSVMNYPPPGGLDEMPEQVRALVLVWTSSGIIGNGGFEYLFESTMNGDARLNKTIQSYQIVGLNELYNIVDKAVRLARSSNGSIDSKKFMRLSAKVRDDLDLDYYRAEKEGSFYRILADLVRTNGGDSFGVKPGVE
jgi:Domain of unknown function (DUF4375)